jgi:hypothetical protein
MFTFLHKNLFLDPCKTLNIQTMYIKRKSIHKGIKKKDLSELDP